MNATLARKMATPLMLHARTAADLMVPNPISLRAEAAVAEAIVLFTEKGITAAPVIDEAGRQLGVDAARAGQTQLPRAEHRRAWASDERPQGRHSAWPAHAAAHHGRPSQHQGATLTAELAHQEPGEPVAPGRVAGDPANRPTGQRITADTTKQLTHLY